MIFDAQAAVLLISMPQQQIKNTGIVLAQAVSVQITQGVDVSVHKTLAGSFLMSHFGKSPVYAKFTCISPSTQADQCKSPLVSLQILYKDYIFSADKQSSPYQFTFDKVTYKGYITQMQKSTSAKYPGVIFYNLVFVGERI